MSRMPTPTHIYANTTTTRGPKTLNIFYTCELGLLDTPAHEEPTHFA